MKYQRNPDTVVAMWDREHLAALVEELKDEIYNTLDFGNYMNEAGNWAWINVADLDAITNTVMPIIDRIEREAYERGYDEGYGMRSLERTGAWRKLGETPDDEF